MWEPCATSQKITNSHLCWNTWSLISVLKQCPLGVSGQSRQTSPGAQFTTPMSHYCCPQSRRFSRILWGVRNIHGMTQSKIQFHRSLKLSAFRLFFFFICSTFNNFKRFHIFKTFRIWLFSSCKESWEIDFEQVQQQHWRRKFCFQSRPCMPPSSCSSLFTWAALKMPFKIRVN